MTNKISDVKQTFVVWFVVNKYYSGVCKVLGNLR